MGLMPVPVGSDVRVNSVTANTQEAPAITALSDRGFVVTWSSLAQDGSGWGIYGQRYSASGTAVGGEFRANSFTSYDQYQSTVTALSDGGFLVSWTSTNLSSPDARATQDGFSAGVYAQRYSETGVAVGGEFRVNTHTEWDQRLPSAAGLGGGGFVVVWASLAQDGRSFAGGNDGVFGQRYTAGGQPVGGEFLVNTTTANDQTSPSVTTLSGGGFLVTWMSYDQDASRWGIYGQRFAADGTKVGVDFRANTYRLDSQQDPSATALSDGGFVIAWTSDGQDGSGFGIYGQRYAANGTVVGGEFRINTYTNNYQVFSSVTALPDGGFVVTWSSLNEDGSGWGIYGQRYAASGQAAGGEFRVNQTTAGDQFARLDSGATALSTLVDGRLVQVWAGTGDVFYRTIGIPELQPPSIASIPENAGGGINAAEASDGTPVVVNLSGTGGLAGDRLLIHWGAWSEAYILTAADIVVRNATVAVSAATIASQGDGTFNVTATITDRAGNSGGTSAAVSVTVDRRPPPPAVSIRSIVENSNGGINGTEAANGTPVVVDFGIDVTRDILTIDWGGQKQTFELTGKSGIDFLVSAATLAKRGDGTFAVTATVTDGETGIAALPSAPISVTVSGTHHVNYSNAAGGIYVDLAAQLAKHAPVGQGWSGGPASLVPVSTEQLADVQDVTGSSFDDLLVGGTNSGTLFGGAGDDLIYGDTAQAAADKKSQVVLDGGTGDNALYGSSAYNIFMAGDAGGGFDQFWGAASKMAGVSGYSNNTLSFANAPASESIYVDLLNGHNAYLNGGNHNDGTYLLEDAIVNIPNVIGSSGGDVIIAGNGPGRITGGAGADELYAGIGVDTFAYLAYGDSNLVSGYDTIENFGAGVDKIDLSALNSSASHLLIETSGTSNSVYLERTAGSFNPSTDLALNVVTTTPGGLHASDFIF